jgi:hypothetical protein
MNAKDHDDVSVDTVTLAITVSHSPAAPDTSECPSGDGADPVLDAHLRSLREWLTREPALRGRVHLRSGPIPDGALSGGLSTALQIIVGGGGAVASIATVVVAWLNTRKTSEISIVLARDPAPDGQQRVELSAKGIKGLDAAGISALTDQATAMLSAIAAASPEEPAPAIPAADPAVSDAAAQAEADPLQPAGPRAAITAEPEQDPARGGDSSPALTRTSPADTRSSLPSGDRDDHGHR